MAKQNKPKNSLDTVPVTDRSWWWSELMTLSPEAKLSNISLAQTLFFCKMNSSELVDIKKANEYRNANLLNIDEGIYKKMFDPITPSGSGGTASYVAADWKALPVSTHLRNIRKAKLDKIGIINKPQVNEINKFSKSQRQRDKDKIIHQRVFRDLISEIATTLGLPPLSRSQTPEEYIEKLQPKTDAPPTDDVTRIMEQIKLQISDDKDYALYERYVYKGEIERAFELGIQYYLMNQNKYAVRSQQNIQDLVDFNRSAYRLYVDETTGRPVYKYLDPQRLYTSPFMQKDGEDIMYWFYEEPTPFADFVRMFGDKLTDEQLQQIFLLNKSSGSGHNLDWECGTQRRNNAMIMTGYCSFLSQDSEDFAVVNENTNNALWTPVKSTWIPDPEINTVKKKIYNVWYEFYYVPPPGEYTARNQQADWVWQSKYIFAAQKQTDMFRYGVDRRYAKSSLIIWKDESPSCTDIEQSMLPKIYNTWHKFQNCLVQDTNAVIIDEDFVLGVLNAVDESNPINPQTKKTSTGSNGTDAALETFRMMRQGGIAMMKFRDKNGNVIPNMKPQDFFVKLDTGHLEKAEKYLQLITQQYEMLKMMLAQSDVTEGMGAKPRVVTASIEASVEASNNSIWFVEYPVREMLVMGAERIIQYIINMVKEKNNYGYGDRWKNFEEVVGLAQSLMIEGIADLMPEELGITVSLEDTTAQQQNIYNMCMQMVGTKEIGFDGAMLAIETAKINYKFAYALVSMFRKQQEQENAAQADVAHQQQMEILEKQNEISLNLIAAKSAGTEKEIQTQGNVDAKLDELLNQMKYQSQAALKTQTTDSKLSETNNKLEKESQLRQQESLI